MESIQITGNKARFDNYLTDPMMIPKNGKVCLNKASFSIPVWTQRFITMPNLAVVTHTQIMMFVNLNGVTNHITWTEFYNAWDAINDVETRTINDFYSGSYNFYMNNLLEFQDLNTSAVSTLPTFTEVLARALDTKFSFFDFVSSDIIINSILVDTVGGDTLTLNGTDYLIQPSESTIKNFSLIAQYAPEKLSDSNPVNMSNALSPNEYWNLNNCRLVGGDGNDLDFNFAGGGATIEGAAIAKGQTNSWAIDPNGGYWGFRASLGNDPCEIGCGILFVNNETKINNSVVGTPILNMEDFKAGIIFKDNGTIETYQVIDGITYDGAGNSEPNLYPVNDIFEYDNDVDQFYIQVRRAAGFEGSSGKFIFRYLQGDINNPGYENAHCFYQTTQIVPSGDVKIVPAVYCKQFGGTVAGGSKINDNVIVSLTQDSIEMGSEALLFTDNNLQIVPNVGNGTDPTVYPFFQSIGLGQNESSSRTIASFISSTLANKIEWSFGSISKKYFIGVNDTKNIFQNNTQHLLLSTSGQTELPRQIEVSLLNLGHTPHTGSFAQDVLFTEPDINKVISYINTDPSYFNNEDNIYLEYVYEAFNFVCRRLKNRSKTPLANFQIKLGYKNFLTNLEEVIDQVRGTVKLEILFQQDQDEE